MLRSRLRVSDVVPQKAAWYDVSFLYAWVGRSERKCARENRVVAGWWSCVGAKKAEDKPGAAGLPLVEQLEPRLLLSADSVGLDLLVAANVSPDDPAVYVDLDHNDTATERDSSAILTYLASPSVEAQAEMPVLSAKATAIQVELVAPVNADFGESPTPVQDESARPMPVDERGNISTTASFPVEARGPPADSGDSLSILSATTYEEQEQALRGSTLNVVLVSDAVAQAEQIQRAATKDTIAIIYHADTMTATGLVNLLASVSAAHDGARIGHLGIVTHGGPGEIDVGNGNNLNLATLPNQSPALEQLRSKLTNDARLDLYACSVASGAGGKTFVDELAAATGTAVFASDNPVGTVPGADFVWEYHTGQAAASDELLLVQGIETIPRLCLADDYPYKNSTPDTVDPWNFYTRECTSYVAWRMNRDAGSTTSPYWFTNNSLDGASCLWGNAENWDDNAASLGFVIDNVPEVGAIAQWNPNESGASSWGHVACVEQVNGDGSVDVSEYNWTTQFAYDVRSNRYAPRYIHVTKFHAGDNILADSTLNVRATAGGTYIDQVTAGRAGTVTGGPTGAVYGGTFYKWYNVNWGSALSGWSTESGLTKSTADTAAPMVSAFSITPTSVTVGSAVTISYTVSDTAGSGLKQVELWRTTDTDGDGEPDWSQDPEGYIAMKPLSGQQSSGYFEDSPSSASTYWYGLHVVDNAGNWSAEPAPPGPITVTVVAPHIITNVYELQAMNSDLAGWYVLGNDIDASVTRTWNDGAGFIPVGSAYSNYFGGHFDGRGYTISGLYVNRPETDNVGLFGYAHYNVIEDVGLTGVDITGRDGVGGLIGVSGYSGSRDRCYTTGIVRGRAYVGGLIGGNGRTPITDCYSHADVYGVSFVGGLIGSNSAYSGGTSEQIEVKHCYSSGLVVGEPGGQAIGGLVGHSMQTNWISCYWDVEASGQTTSAGGLGKMTQEMKWQATYTFTADPWGFDTVWNIQEESSYPFLRLFTDNPQVPPPCEIIGSGTEQDPYIVTNVKELQAMNNRVTWGTWYVLGNDIDASVTRTWNDGAGFIPIGSAYSNYFGGHFDGRGYTISGLYINRPETDNVGLFGYAHYNVIEDVGLTGVDITGRDGVGGLIGVSGYSGSRDRCYTTGIVRGRAYVGGLIGGNGRTPITDCYSHADVYGVSFVGGLIGSNSAYSGGTSEQIEVKHCYSSGLVVGEPGGQPVGGLVGHSMQTNWISCYWDVEASGQTTSTGGLGKTTQEMKQQATFVEWDFADTWMMPAGDYPRLIGVESSEVGRIVLTEPLETTYGPYILGDSLTATFTVQNTGDGAITLDKLLLGGRFNDGELPGGGYPDFSYDTVTLQPGESYAYQGTLTIPEPGAYDFFIAYYIENPTDAEKDFLDANNWDTNVELDTGLTDADRTRHIEAVSPPPGYAVIVAGDADWRQKFAIDHSANNAYRALRNLGFDDDHIFYLNTVQQQVAGASVVDGSPSQEDLQDCLDSIKQQIGDRLTPLILYLVGHGLGEVFDFYTDSEPLSSHNLRDMLAPFEGNPTLVVLGSCYSGSFITQRFTADPDSISSDNRIVITAAHDDEERTSLLGLGGWYHSSDRFWGNLSEGMNVRNAFETGAWPGERQHLWLDDNGDCTGHSPGDLADDGVLASSMIVGVPGTEHLVLTSWYSVWIHSPGELRVYDSENRVTGLVNGEIKEEIPGVMYYPEDEMVVVYSLSDTYRYEVVATDGGTYGLDIVLVQEGEAVVFAATDIPVTVGTRHEYAVDWAALSRGEEAVTLNVDAEGDGVFEQTITADATLQPPVANAGGPYSGFTGEPIVLDASGSNDPDGQISLYEWDWNGDGVYDYGTGSAQCGHTWPSAFNGNIVLRVTDDDGLTNTATATATVTVNEAPTLTTLQTLIGAHKGYPYTITYESLATAANEVDPDGDVVRFRIESISSGTKSLAKGGINVTPGTPQAILGPAESWVWTPAKGKTGVLDAFTMKAWDGNLASATAVQVKIKVDPVPDLRPTAVDSSVWQSAEPGTLVDWTVTVKNSGRGPQWADWTVQWYLSSDKKYQNTDTLIGSPQTYSDDIAKSASVTKTYNAPVPAVPIAGQKYVIGRVVNTGPDAKASNNTRASKDKDWFGQVDPDADEPNNTLETATDLGTPTGKVARQNLTIDSAQDVDWYKFTMTKAGTSKGKVQIDFTNAEGDLALALYGSGEVPIRQVDKTGKTEVIKLKGLAVGTYHLKVLSLHGDVSRNYRVTLIL
jgi:surface antigen